VLDNAFALLSAVAFPGPDGDRRATQGRGSRYAATVAAHTADHGPSLQRVLTRRPMETAVLPPPSTLNSARQLGRVVMVRNERMLGSVGYFARFFCMMA
jgi:hypothetical protein